MAVVGNLDGRQLAERVIDKRNVNPDRIRVHGIPNKLRHSEHRPASRCQPFQMVVLDLDLDGFGHYMIARLLGGYQVEHLGLSMRPFYVRNHVHQLGNRHVRKLFRLQLV